MTKLINYTITLYAIAIIIIAALITIPSYRASLNYSYVTHDTLGNSSVNYAEPWTYVLNGSRNGIFTIIAYKTLRSYIIKVNASNGLVLGAYYLQPPHYNITFGGIYYEPVILLNTPSINKPIVLLNSIRFSWKQEGNYYFLYNYSIIHQENGTLVQKYYFLFSRISGYMLNEIIYYSYMSKSENYTLHNQIVLDSIN